MPENLTYNVLFRGPTVAVRDVRCRPAGCECGPEEHAGITTIAFPRAGVFVKHIDRRQIVANCNHVVFFNAGDAYRVSHPAPWGDDCTTLAFAPEVLAEAVARFDPAAGERPGSPIGLTHGPLEPRLGFLMQALRQRMRAGPLDALEAEELAIKMLASVLESAYRIRGRRPVERPGSAASIHRDRVEAAKGFIAARFNTPIALADIARHVHYSQYHLARLFQRETGMPLHRYRNALRLAAAVERLADGARDLAALALELGYSSHSHLSDAFVRTFGVPPSSFRRTLTWARLRELSKNLKAASPVDR